MTIGAKGPAPIGGGHLPPRWLVVVGASGRDGLIQMVELIGRLPGDLPAAVLAVLHRPPDRSSYLPDILQRASRMPVYVADQGEPLEEGACYLGSPARHLRVSSGALADLVADHVYRGTNIDLLFESAAQAGGPRVIGVVLAGALRDGARGLAAVKLAGGRAMIVDEIWAWREGMPRAAMRAVPDADVVASVGEIARAIERTVAVAA